MGNVMCKRIAAPVIQDGGPQVKELYEDGLLKINDGQSRARGRVQHSSH